MIPRPSMAKGATATAIVRATQALTLCLMADPFLHRRRPSRCSLRLPLIHVLAFVGIARRHSRSGPAGDGPLERATRPTTDREQRPATTSNGAQRVFPKGTDGFA